ncbi:MAG: MoxR family ATPase [Oscillospiraceae bacterium]|nr:MoxR family ATPase [Oscillospiraceae bacterium]
MNELTERIQQEIRRVVLGKDEAVEKVLMAILAKGHVLLEDVPGVGKTTMAMSFSRVLGLETRRVQFTSDTMPSDILGYSVYNKDRGEMEYKKGAVMTNLLLADEINRTSSKTQSALLEAMEEGHVTVDGVTYPLPSPFVVLATQNPVGSAGTTALPNSQLDRFIIRMSMGYPDAKTQSDIMRERHHENPLDRVQSVTDAEGLVRLIDEVQQTYMADEIYDYISALVEKTRTNPFVVLGVSPRGALALCRCAKARGFLQGRDYVLPEDVQAVFLSVCAHRLMLSSKAKLHDYTAEGLLAAMLDEVKAPESRAFKKL